MSNNAIAKLLAAEVQLQSQMGRFVRDTVAKIEQAPPIEGVQTDPTLPCAVITTSFAMVRESLFSPEFFMQSAQAAAVEDVLKTRTSVADLFQTVQSLIDQKTVRRADNSELRLNPATITVLKATGIYHENVQSA